MRFKLVESINKDTCEDITANKDEEEVILESNTPGQRRVREVLCDMMSICRCDISIEDADKYILHHRSINKNDYRINNLLLIPSGITFIDGELIKDIHSKLHSIFRKPSSERGSYDYDVSKFMERFKIINVYASIIHGSLTYLNDPSVFDVVEDYTSNEGINESIIDNIDDSTKEYIEGIKSILKECQSIDCQEKTITEVYPNKGESKEDFISRFMSVTKDEYPDQKQRYAVALSYWDRRDK